MDRISNLPDHLLCRMLSVLPTKDAVATSILSPRWKYLWTSIPIVDFDARPPRLDLCPVINMDANLRSEIAFQNFVSRVMLLKGMPYIRIFRLIYDCHLRSALIRTWFHAAISHDIQEVELDLCMSVRGTLAALPRKFFTSGKLVVLKLSRMALKVPSFVSFPSLKILELRRIMYIHDNCMQNLLSGCRVLEELVIEEIAREKPKVVDISIHTLRSFNFSCRFVIDTMVDCPYTFIINAPNLEYFHVRGRISDVFEVRNLSALSNALVDLRQAFISSEDYMICHQRIFHLLEGISNAKSIVFSGEVVQLLCEAFNQSLPRFSNLMQLAFGIGVDFRWKRLLTEFIKSSPHLKIFDINNKLGFSRDMEELRKISLEPLPDNLISYLKKNLIVELYATSMPEYILNLVQHVNVLRRLKINCRCPIMLTSQIGFTS